MVMNITERKDPPKPSTDELKELRQKLGAVMSRYAEVFHKTIEQVENDLYRRLKVGSRTELSSDELRREFLSYKASIDNRVE